ncbi:MAG: hypothetical protein J6K29_08660 [Clostridia bacterium]|nr:hypothetical protein [Clostridia bacterium]MBP3667108.1 hypothetical protein [Clostridia bacterium]
MEKLLAAGRIENAAIISFHDPVGCGRRRLEDYSPIDFSGKCDRVMQIAIHDLDPEALSDFGLTVESYFPEAEGLRFSRITDTIPISLCIIRYLTP